jgi:hypothetical protein
MLWEKGVLGLVRRSVQMEQAPNDVPRQMAVLHMEQVVLQHLRLGVQEQGVARYDVLIYKEPSLVVVGRQSAILLVKREYLVLITHRDACPRMLAKLGNQYPPTVSEILSKLSGPLPMASQSILTADRCFTLSSSSCVSPPQGSFPIKDAILLLVGKKREREKVENKARAPQ